MIPSPRSLTQSDKEARYVRGLLRAFTPPTCRQRLEFDTTTNSPSSSLTPSVLNSNEISAPKSPNSLPVGLATEDLTRSADRPLVTEEFMELSGFGTNGFWGETDDESRGGEQAEDREVSHDSGEEESTDKEETENIDGQEEGLDGEAVTAIHDLAPRYEMRIRRNSSFFGRTKKDRQEHDSLVDQIMGKDDVNVIRKGDVTTAAILGQKRKRTLKREVGEQKKQGMRRIKKQKG